MDRVRISIDLSEPARQQLKVKLEWTPRVLHQSWLMPVWTTGSYTVRDHAQHFGAGLQPLDHDHADRVLLVVHEQMRCPHRWLPVGVSPGGKDGSLAR